MAFDFPSAPTVNQVYTPIPGLSYKWNGTTWDVTSLVNPDAPSDGKTYGRKDAGWNEALPISGGTLTGDLTIKKVQAGLILDRPAAGVGNRIYGRTNGLDRWIMGLANSGAESGANAGSDFTLQRYDDAGNSLGSGLDIYRANATALFYGLVSLGTTGQLQFPPTANPSSNANTLDDYREGSWVPDLTFNGGKVGLTYSSRAGYYTKVGRNVHCWGSIVLNGKGTSTGNLQLEGLPFVGSLVNMEGMIHWYNGAASMTTLAALHGNSGQSFCYFDASTAGGVGSTFYTDANVTLNFGCSFSIYYPTNQ